MEGTRGKALMGWVLLAALLVFSCPAHAAVGDELLARTAAQAANNAVFSTDCPGADLMPDAVNRTEVRMATVCLLNRVRVAAGLSELTSVRVLRRIAAEHSRDMVIRHYFDHTGPARVTLASRLRSVGWQGTAGENLGYGSYWYATPRAMVWAWMRSPGHRTNILDPEFRYVGAAISLGAPAAVDGPAATYTTDFGGR